MRLEISRLALFAIALTQSSTLLAFEPSESEPKNEPHVVELDKRLTIAPFFDIPGTQMSLIYRPESGSSTSNSTSKDHFLTYSHKLIQTFGAAVTYGNIGWSVKHQPSYNKKADSGKGKTEHTDFRTTYSLPKIMFDLFYQRYRGFYVSSYKVGDNQKSLPSIEKIRPDMEVDNTGFISTYIFKGDTFAARAGFDFSKKQARTGHSPMVSLSYLSSHIRDQESMIPPSAKADYGKFSEFNNARLHSLNVSGGYGVNVVVKDFIFHAAGQLGAGGTQAKYSLAEGDQKKQLYSVDLDLRLAVGYNTAHYFSGLSYMYHTVNTVIGDLSLMRGIYSATIVGGIRW